MTSQAAAQRAPISPEKTVATLISADALAMLEHGSEMTIGITTPVGTTFRAKTTLIGSHTDNLVLVEMPKISDEDKEFFFQEGFWLNVRAISQRGEGAIVQFRSQIIHVLTVPLAMMAISIPKTMQVAQLRKEPRYDVNLAARAVSPNSRVECEIRDLSKGGCRYVTSPLAKSLEICDPVQLVLMVNGKPDTSFPVLTGSICNVQRCSYYARYGIKFDEKGVMSAKALLGRLKFDGTKLALR